MRCYVFLSDDSCSCDIIKYYYNIVDYLWETYLPRNLPHAQLKYSASELASLFIKNANFQPSSASLAYTSIDRMGYYLGPIVKFS